MSRTHHQRRARIARLLARSPRRPVVPPAIAEPRTELEPFPMRALDLVDDDLDDHLGDGQPLRSTFVEVLRLAFSPERGSVDRGLVFAIGLFGFGLFLAALPFEAALALVLAMKVAVAAAVLRGKQ